MLKTTIVLDILFKYNSRTHPSLKINVLRNEFAKMGDRIMPKFISITFFKANIPHSQYSPSFATTKRMANDK